MKHDSRTRFDLAISVNSSILAVQSPLTPSLFQKGPDSHFVRIDADLGEAYSRRGAGS
jgi:hypothetical protein